MKWQEDKPFYEQKCFWLGVAVVCVLLRLLQGHKIKVIICGNNNGNNEK